MDSPPSGTGSSPLPSTAALERALLTMDRLQARAIVSDHIRTHSPLAVVEQLFVPVMERIGTAWEDGELSLSQVYLSGQLCQELAGGLEWQEAERPHSQPPMAIVVLEDYHMLGKQMVHSALRAAGYRILDYGRMEVDPLVRRVERDGIRLLLVSTLMLRAALRVKPLRERLNALGWPVKLLVGGAPFRFDRELWREVGADAMALNTAEALQMVRRFA